MTIFTLGPFRLDARNDLLWHGTEPATLGKRAIALLRALVERPGELVSKDTLIEAAWPGRIVEENNLTVQIAALRQVLGTAPDGGRWIETMPRRGYRFIGPVVTEAEQGLTPPPVDAGPTPAPALGDIATGASTQRDLETSEAEAVPPLPDRPSIAVLPFDNMSRDVGQDYFVDGMVEEIITALSRIRWLFVIARNSTFTYKGQAVDVKQVGRELGVRYLLEGSVRKGRGRVRITAQLVEAETGAHLWADRFDGSVKDVFKLQDQVAASVAGVIEPALQAAETARSAHRATADLTAYDIYLRGCAMASSSAARYPEALGLMERAITRDPRYGPALALAAWCCVRLLSDGRSEDRAADRRKGIDFARRALEAAGDDPGVLVDAAFALAYFGEDIGAMLALVDRALTLNPNFARGWHVSGILRNHAGWPDIAIEHAELSLRLSPRTRIGRPYTQIGLGHLLSRRFDQAVPKLLLAIQDRPSATSQYRYLAACYAHMGRLDEAREIVARLRAITSVVSPDASYLRNAEHRELLLSGLRLAIGETT